MNQISIFNRPGAWAFIILMTLSGSVFAENKTNFTINGKAVPTIVAKVNGIELTSKLLKREMIAYQLLASREGQVLEEKDEGKIARGLLMKAIDDELVYQQGLKQDIKIESVTIEREIKHIQTQFPDKKLFLSALAAQRLTFDVLKSNIKKTLVKEEFIRIKIAPQVKVDDKQVKYFYEENKATFKNPETFHISHIYVAIPRPSDGKIESAEDQTKANEIIDWVKKEAQKKIIAASLALKTGKTFSNIAKEFSEDAETSQKGGDLGFISKGQALPEISSAMVKLNVGGTSSVIESSLGFHIIHLNNIKESHFIALDEVKSEILNHLLKIETNKYLQNYLSDLRKISKIKIFI
jgi:parvulin-like peptidyl-prolyl isomerase